MKKKIIKGTVLVFVFVAALVAGSRLMNRETEDSAIVDMDSPTLPQVSFLVEGQEVNWLSGYVDEMDIPAMRDTITPVAENGILQMKLKGYGQEINSVRYEVYSLSGTEIYFRGTVRDFSGEAVSLALGQAFPEGISESVLKVILNTNKRKTPVFFYTRIEPKKELSVKECLGFAMDFHEKTFDKSSAGQLEQYLEPNEESDNTTFQTVNIHSDVAHIQWGNLDPYISTEVRWSIKESNSVYTSLLAEYQAVCKEEDRKDSYNIKEFFRVRSVEGEMYLLNYERHMNQLFDGGEGSFDQAGIMLGLAEGEVPYETSSDGSIIAFVQERELWLYSKEENELALVFSFANVTGHDVRSETDKHVVRILHVDDSGNTAFAVYGYMNRGVHEGRTGADIYYYDRAENVAKEKAFIASKKSFAITAAELGKLVYYNEEKQLLYVLSGNALYRIALENGEKEMLAEGLQEGAYTVSIDGRMFAFQTTGEENQAKSVMVLNLESGESFTIQAAEGEAVRPLGFINHDFVCGYLRTADQGMTAAGQVLSPMYKLEIRNGTDGVLKTYMQEGIYLTDIKIEKKLMTLNRAIRNENIYTNTSPDYITNNEESKESMVALETTATEVKETQMRFTFADGLEELTPEIIRPRQILEEDALMILFDDKTDEDKYYVYGMGELVGIYEKAAPAIQNAEKVSGVVVSSAQSYIWEKGNRDLVYYTEAQPFQRAEGQSSLDACQAYMEQYGAKRVDLTGCSLEQVLYVINIGLPVTAVLDAGHAVLLTGYSPTTVTYFNPEDGGTYTVSMDEMQNIAAMGGNTFIGYVR